MILRFRIATPSNTGAPDYTICGQGDSVTPHSNLAVSVSIDNEVIWSTNDLSTPGFPASVTTAANGILIDNFAIENSEWIKMEVHLAETWTSTPMTIVASKTGYIGYSNTFEIYGYDLGNNPNQTNTHAETINYNPDFTIYLLDETNNVVNGVQTKAFASFIAFRKPFTREIYFYSSNGGAYSYEYKLDDVDGTVIGSGRNFVHCNEESESYKLKVTLANGDTCETSTKQVNKVVHIPTFNIGIACNQQGILTPNDQPSSLGPVECSNNLATNTAKTFIDYSSLHIYYVSDTKSYPYDEQRITYALYGSGGDLKKSKVVEITINPPDYTYNPHDAGNLWNFSIDEIGDHTLQVKVGGKADASSNIYECWENMAIHNSNFFAIEETENCGTYDLVNYSYEALTIDILKMDKDGNFQSVSTVNLPSLGTVTEVWGDDGMYQVKLERTLTKNNDYGVITDGSLSYNYIFVVANYCNLKNCTFDYLNKLICNPNTSECDKCKAEDYYNFNALFINALTYFGMLQEEYQLNYLYTALTPNKLQELYNLDSFLQRFVEYCDECKTANTNCGCS